MGMFILKKDRENKDHYYLHRGLKYSGKNIHMVLEKNLQSTDNLGFATYILLYNLLLYWLNALKRAYVMCHFFL